MAFPLDVVAEIAFSNDLNETEYASTGWTEVTPFVSSISGTLRGTDYELDQPQAGSITVSLDNADGRFTPSKVSSPYYPNVKSNRRFRFRGKNMQTINVGRTGAADHSAFDFFDNPALATRFDDSPAFNRIEAEDYFANGGPVTIATTADVDGGSDVTKVTGSTWLAYTEDFGTVSPSAVQIRVSSYNGCTIQLRAGSQTGTVLGTAVVPGKSNYTDYDTYTISGLSGLTGVQVMYLTLTSGPAGTDWCHINWLKFLPSDQMVSEPVAVQHDSAALGFTGNMADVTEGWHIEATAHAGMSAGDNAVIAWYTPVELGQRLTHSAYVWRTDGTEPTGSIVGFEIHYYDSTETLISTAGTQWLAATGTTPARQDFSDLPPANTKYAIGRVVLHNATTTTEDITYAIAGIQTEQGANLAPNISGGPDCAGWTSNGGVFTQAGVANQGSLYLASLTDTFANLSAWTSGGSPSVSGGKLQFATGTSGSYSQVTSRKMDMRGSGFSVRVEVASDLPAQSEFYATAQIDASNAATFVVSGASWICRLTTAGTNTDVYNPVSTHPSVPAYLCIREANGVVYWDTSTDGTTWTTIYSAAHSLDFSKTAINMQGGSYATNTADTISVSQLNLHHPQPAVTVTWKPNGTQIQQGIPRLIPGEIYTATAEVKKASGSPDVLFSMTEGLDGDTLTVDDTWTTVTTTWTAASVIDTMSLICASDPPDDITLSIRKINVREGSSAALAGALDDDVSEWQRPKPMFEGWIDSWPVVTTAGTTEDVQVTVNDRLSKLANIDFTTVLTEELFSDYAGLILPLTDPSSDSGSMAQLGSWADDMKTSYMQIQHTRGDMTGATYSLGSTTGIAGDETALTLSYADTTRGYLIVLPYSKDYNYAPALPPPTIPPTTPPDDGSNSGSTGGSTQYATQYGATWVRTYDSGGGTRDNDPDLAYQGSSGVDGHGNQRSLYGFNYAAIAAGMTNATVLSVTLSVYVAHTWFSGGSTFYFGTHNSASKPSTYPSGDSHLVTQRWHKQSKAGQWITVQLSPSVVSEIIGGTTKGIVVGPAPSSSQNYYGYLGGVSSQFRPYLTVTYQA